MWQIQVFVRVPVITEPEKRQMEWKTEGKNSNQSQRKRDKHWDKRGWERELWRACRLECVGQAPAEPSIQAGLTSETGNLSCMLHHLPYGVVLTPLSCIFLYDCVVSSAVPQCTVVSTFLSIFQCPVFSWWSKACQLLLGATVNSSSLTEAHCTKCT